MLRPIGLALRGRLSPFASFARGRMVMSPLPRGTAAKRQGALTHSPTNDFLCKAGNMGSDGEAMEFGTISHIISGPVHV